MQRRDGVVIDDGQHELRYITAELLQVQAAALSGWARGRGGGAGVVPMSTRWSGRWRTIRSSTPSSVALVTRWCTSGDRVQAAVGRAGTGKTTTMRVAADRVAQRRVPGDRRRRQR